MKLRSGYLVCNKGLKMDTVKETSQESATENVTRDQLCQEKVSTESVSDTNTPKEDRPSENMFESFTSQLNLLKEHINQKIDSINSQLSCKIDAKMEELKLDMVNNFVNFQKEVKSHIESKQKDLTAKLLGFRIDKTVENPITVTLEPDNTGISKNQNDQVLIDIEQSATTKQSSHSDISSSNIVQIGETSHSAKVPTPGMVTPLKAFSLPSITDSPDYLRAVNSGLCPTSGSNSVIVPCNMLQNIPVLTVAPAHSSITICSPSIQSPVTRPLRTLKPKLTTEEFIGSDFDADSEDYVRPIRLYSTGAERLILPGNQRVRTRGGLRRGGITPTDGAGKLKSSNTFTPDKGDANRGGRRGRKLKAFPVIRRQSERLKKGEHSDSPKKTNFQETIGDIEEFIWGKQSDKSTEPTPEKVAEETSVQNSSETRKETKVNVNSSGLDSLLQIDNICNNMHSSDTSNKTKASQEETKTEILSLGTASKTDPSSVNVPVTESDSSNSKIKSSEGPKETPRNLPGPSRKGLSLSSPRKGTHIRALDFSTPNKKPTPRKANTSPKSVSQVKLAQMRALRRTNLFKSPAKKPKQSWDADLRSFVAPDIPLSSVNMRKRIPLKRPGRASKLSPKKMMWLKKTKKKKCEKGQSNNKKDTSENASDKIEKTVDIFNSTTQDSPTKTTEELVKQIEKDVLEVIAEENSASENADNSDMINQSSITDIANNPNEMETRTQSEENNKTSIDKSSIPLQNAGKLTNKTPAKLDFAGLIAANMMTPVTKILKEQSSILDNVQFLTPGFLPTPDGIANRDADVRKVATPSPKSYPQKELNKNDSDSDQSPVGIKECPVRIEDALAAEEQVVKPIQKEPLEKPQTSKAKEKTPKKKTPLRLAQKTPISEKKSKKKKSVEELIIDQCLKNVEKDLFGTTSKKSPKKNVVAKEKNVRKKKVVNKKEKPAKSKNIKNKDKKSKTTDTPILATKSNEKQNTGIKLPSFEEMMSRLNKLNQLSSSSSDSSDSDVEKIRTDEARNSVSNDSFPRLRVSEEESLCSISAPFRFKTQNQTSTLTKVIKIPEKPPSTKKVSLVKDKPFEYKETLSKKVINKVETLVSPSRPSIKEQIKDFSYGCRSNSSLKEFSFDYFDEGKNGNRQVMASPIITLFEFPFDKKKLSNKSDIISSKNTFPPPDNTSKEVLECSSLYKKKADTIFKSPLTDKSDNLMIRVESSKSFRPLNVDESRKRAARFIRSISREPRHSLKKGRLGLSSHRSRFGDRSVTPMERRRGRERYGDTVHKRYKQERTEEFRRKGVTGGSRSHRDRRSRSSERRVHSSAHSRSETRKDRELPHSPEYRSAKIKCYLNPSENLLRNFEDSEKKFKSKEIPNKKSHVSEKSSHIDILRNRSEERKTSSSLSSNKLDGRNQPVHVSALDPRVHLKHREPQILISEKPLAESTPYEKGRHLKEFSNINPNRSNVRKSLHGDTSTALKEGWQSSHNNPESRYISTGFKGSSQRILRMSKETRDLDNEHFRNEFSSSVKQKNSFKTTAPSENYIIESPSSPSDLSPESPPRDPRLTSRLSSDFKRFDHPEKMSKLGKRKIEDLEEGEISDESVSSYSRKQPCYDNRRRKLSNIPEIEAGSDVE